MASTLTAPGSSDYSKFAGLLRRQLRAAPAAVAAPLLGATLPIELALWQK